MYEIQNWFSRVLLVIAIPRFFFFALGRLPIFASRVVLLLNLFRGHRRMIAGWYDFNWAAIKCRTGIFNKSRDFEIGHKMGCYLNGVFFCLQTWKNNIVRFNTTLLCIEQTGTSCPPETGACFPSLSTNAVVQTLFEGIEPFSEFLQIQETVESTLLAVFCTESVISNHQ